MNFKYDIECEFGITNIDLTIDLEEKLFELDYTER